MAATPPDTATLAIGVGDAMDLRSEAERLRLDLVAVAVSHTLARAGIPHVLLKGPSTALWLYAEPRRYRDVDILVAPSRIEAARDALQSAGVARADAGRIGEEADHSLLMHSSEGYELDLHRSLPSVSAHDDRVWDALSEHVVSLDLGVGSVPALDEVARCLVLALHALHSGRHATIPAEDLRRARSQASDEIWQAARLLAEAIDAQPLFDAGLACLDPSARHGDSTLAALHLTNAPNAAFGLYRLAAAPWSQRPVLVAREVWPSAGFMRVAYPQLTGQHCGLVRAHLHRWWLLSRQLPSAVHVWRVARRDH